MPSPPEAALPPGPVVLLEPGGATAAARAAPFREGVPDAPPAHAVQAGTPDAVAAALRGEVAAHDAFALAAATLAAGPLAAAATVGLVL